MGWPGRLADRAGPGVVVVVRGHPVGQGNRGGPGGMPSWNPEFQQQAKKRKKQEGE